MIYAALTIITTVAIITTWGWIVTDTRLRDERQARLGAERSARLAHDRADQYAQEWDAR